MEGDEVFRELKERVRNTIDVRDAQAHLAYREMGLLVRAELIEQLDKL